MSNIEHGMKKGEVGRLLLWSGVAAWAALFIVPLASLYLGAGGPSPGAASTPRLDWLGTGLRSVGLSAGVAALAVLLGYIPGKLLAGSFMPSSPTAAGSALPSATQSMSGEAEVRRQSRRRAVLLFLLLLPLLLPAYVLSFAWRMLLSPSTALGQYVSSRPDLAYAANLLTTYAVLLLWHWPVAALLLAQGWRNIAPSSLEMARLDAGPARRFTGVVLPLLGGPILLAFGTCFVLSLGEYTTFHLAGLRTIGTDVDVMFRLGRDEHVAARAAWPLALLAAAVATALWRASARARPGGDSAEEGAASTGVPRGRRAQWIVLAALLAVSCAAPIGLFVAFLSEPSRFRQFGALHWDQLQWSALVAAVAGLISLWIARTATAFGRPPRGNAANARWGKLPPLLSAIMQVTILLCMFLPPSLLAVALLKIMAALDLPAAIRNSWLAVSAGLVLRYCGLATIVLWFARRSEDRQLEELSAVDGASPFRAWLHVHLPRHWPLPAGAFLMVLLFGLTEVPATMLLLPPGLPSLPQWLLDQMHHLRDQHVVVACLVLIGAYLALAAAAAFVMWLFSQRSPRRYVVIVPALLCLLLAGCGNRAAGRAPDVEGAFGRTGSGEGEFLYPRAIALAADGSVWVIDKTGRAQHFSPDGKFLSSFSMPLAEAGKPTGLAIGPEGYLYVADTHYHRVLVFSPDGRLVRQFGRFGREDGCFLYPTHVAFAPDGRIFVSEYGGNDRISVFSPDGNFLRSFGSPGEGAGQFSRPAAMAVDSARGRLYIADACNHRIAVYDLDGRPLGCFGSVGDGPGELRYPYGLSLLGDGSLAVCEFGNNRVQVFGPDGRSLRVCGEAGRALGQLAYPWGVAVDGRRRAFVVDAGNNRVQIWRL